MCMTRSAEAAVKAAAQCTTSVLHTAIKKVNINVICQVGLAVMVWACVSKRR